ncbi:hypothetical protein ABPG72_020220 [Tetrahymena utriculariae]
MVKIQILRLDIEIFDHSNNKENQNAKFDFSKKNQCIQQFFKSFQYLEQLQQFNIRLYDIYIKQNFLEQLSLSIQKFSKLQTLEIVFYKVQINPNTLLSFSETFKHLVNLQKLNLVFEECKSGKQNIFQPLFLNLNYLKKLLHLELNLGQNRLISDELEQICKSLQNLKYLQSLFLDIKFSFKIEQFLIKQIVNYFKVMEKLISLELYFELQNYNLEYNNKLLNTINLIFIKPKRLVICDISVV